MKSLRLIVSVSALLFVGQAHAAGVPQMDPTWHANQLLWLAVSFGLLYVLVAAFIAPTISGILARRESAINHAIVEAERAQRAADTTRSDFESGEQTARVKAAELIAKAHAEATRDAATAAAKLEQDMNRKAAQAQTRIDEARSKAESQMQQATASLAAAIAQKLLGHSVTDEEANAATSNLKKAG